MAANEDLVHGWVSSDCGRGTSDILWSCLSTILLCVWTVIHLPVPCVSRFEGGKLVPGEPERSWRNWIIRSGIVPAVFSVVAPEILTFIAISELYQARQSQKGMTQMQWTLTHTFFLHAGGFCLETPEGLRRQLDGDDLQSAILQSGSPDWLSKLEEVKEVHINDHAKSNPLTKFIACGQALWLVTQVISRICQHQAVTLLEVSTLAYAVCALTAYAAWWKKPQNATLPITIPCFIETIPRKCPEDSLYCNEVSFVDYLWAGQNWTRHIIVRDEIFEVLFCFCPAVFGAIHVASWNSTLPSNVEQWLWRASALYCCAAFIIILLVDLIGDEPEDRRYNTLRSIVRWMMVVFFLIYIIVRLYMIFEVFLSLRALPRSAYESVQWPSFLPHI